MTIQEDLEHIEEAYGDSKMRKVNGLINKLRKSYSEPEFEQAAENFFSLSLPESDRTLYNKIKNDYEGKASEQLGGRCRYAAGSQRCFTNPGADVAPECEATTGPKGNPSCRRSKATPVYGPVKPSKKAYAAATKRMAALENADWAEVDQLVNKLYQTGGRCRYAPGSQRCFTNPGADVAPECEATTGAKGIPSCRRSKATPVYGPVKPSKKAYAAAAKRMAALENADWAEVDELVNKLYQTGGRCRYAPGSQRCFSSPGADVAPECEATTGPKGNKSCRRSKATPVYGPVKESKMAHKEATRRLAALKAKDDEEIEQFFQDPLFHQKFQVGGTCGYKPLKVHEGTDQFGGGCRFNTPLGRCFADKSSNFAPECTATKGPKGNQGCARRAGLTVHRPQDMGPFKRTMSEETKAKIRATRAYNQGLKNPQWQENKLYGTQTGGYWTDDGNSLPSEADDIIGDELAYEGPEQLGAGCRFNAGIGRCYADKSNNYAPECTKRITPKGYEGCSRREGLVIHGPQELGPFKRTMSEETKAKIRATKARNAALRK